MGRTGKGCDADDSRTRIDVKLKGLQEHTEQAKSEVKADPLRSCHHELT